ncbi:MAG: hypothetical protein ABIR24_07725 [Verrucomicrobiota bacterium]
MATQEKFYQCAGYYSLPFSIVPLATVTYLNFFGCFLPLFFGALGFWFAISGMWRGWIARLCALISLLIFAHLGLTAFAYNASF